MSTKELKLADLVNDASICWDYSYDHGSGTLELTVDLDTVANKPTDAEFFAKAKSSGISDATARDYVRTVMIQAMRSKK